MTRINNTITENFARIAEIRYETETPTETISAAVREMGREAVEEAVAVAVNLNSWDGRISDRNREWAQTVTAEGRENQYLEGIDRLHPANLDQLADECRESREADEEAERAINRREAEIDVIGHGAPAEDDPEEERRKALFDHLIVEGIANEDELHEVERVTYYDHGFSFGGDCYIVLTDEEANEEAREAILRDLWAFRAEFIVEHSAFYEDSTTAEDEAVIEALEQVQGRICEGATALCRALIKDIDVFVEDAIDADGRGHFLSMYDGEEYESGEYFIYRN